MACPFVFLARSQRSLSNNFFLYAWTFLSSLIPPSLKLPTHMGTVTRKICPDAVWYNLSDMLYFAPWGPRWKQLLAICSPSSHSCTKTILITNMFFLSRVYDDWKIYYSYSYSCLVGTLVNLFPTRVNFSTRPTICVKFELIAKVRKHVNTKLS